VHYIFIIWLQYAVYDLLPSGLRKISDRVHRHVVGKLGGRGGFAKNCRRGADDLSGSDLFRIRRLPGG
jgi:hypothetical protein